MTASDASERRRPLWWVLVRHEWRLTTRDFFRGGSRGRRSSKSERKPRPLAWRIAWYVVAFVVLHGIAGSLTLIAPRRLHDDAPTRLVACAMLLFLFTLMLASAMSRIVSAFHERRDLDLLLSAPIAPALILVIRALTVVAAVTLTFATFLFPFADVGLVSGRWWMVRFYPLVPLTAALATALALMATGAVVRLIGVRRARVGLQIFSALVGASFYLVSQARQFLPQRLRQETMDWMMRVSGEVEPPWPVRFATDIAVGDGWTWFAFSVCGIGLFAASVWLARKRFFEVAQVPEADSRVVAPATGAVARRIGSGFGRTLFAALLVKEWRLIVRAPQLLSQILLQLLYLMPLMFVAFGHGDANANWSAAAFAAGIVGVTSTLATSLAWLTVSAEDAPDLLAGSPKGASVLLGAKLVAAASPPVLLLFLAALGTARRSPVDAAILLAFGTLACASAAILEASSSSPGKRNDFQRRHRGRGLSALTEGFQFLLWAAATGTAVSGYRLIAAGLVAVACILPALRLPRALGRLRVA